MLDHAKTVIPHSPGLHSAGAAAGALALPYVPADSAELSPHPVPLLGGFPHAEVPLSTAAEGEEGSPHEASGFAWIAGISPQPAEIRKGHNVIFSENNSRYSINTPVWATCKQLVQAGFNYYTIDTH